MLRTFSLLCLLASLFTLPKVQAQSTQLNYSQHIAPILYAHCTRCHRPGEVAPFSLLTYDDVVQHGITVQYVTSTRYMPPWKPDPGYQHYLDENTLTDNEISQIKNWVDGGMPQGNPALAPPVPTYADGSQLGTPDLVIPMSQRFTVPGTNKDLYQVFVLPVNLPADRDIAAIEFRPGNKKLVHHSIIAMDTTNQGDRLDALDPSYGYMSFGGFGFTPSADNFANWVPGAQARFYPAGMGKRLLHKARLLVQVHYGPTSTPQTDSSVVNIFFSRQPVKRYITTRSIITPSRLGIPFKIPPGQVKTFHFSFALQQNASLLSVQPHSHLLCKSWKVWIVKPIGDTLKAVKIDDWNFRWQGAYTFLTMQHVPYGSRIEGDVLFDNTVNNDRNPNSPPQEVDWGENTTDEMLLGYFNILPYQAGDEAVVLATRAAVPIATNSATDDFLLHPNPSELGEATASFTLPQASPVSLTLLDEQGRLVRTVLSGVNRAAGPQQVPLQLDGLAAGLYLVQLQASGYSRTGKLLVQ